jgi:hypothetical protein
MNKDDDLVPSSIRQLNYSVRCIFLPRWFICVIFIAFGRQHCLLRVLSPGEAFYRKRYDPTVLRIGKL